MRKTGFRFRFALCLCACILLPGLAHSRPSRSELLLKLAHKEVKVRKQTIAQLVRGGKSSVPTLIAAMKKLSQLSQEEKSLRLFFSNFRNLKWLIRSNLGGKMFPFPKAMALGDKKMRFCRPSKRRCGPVRWNKKSRALRSFMIRKPLGKRQQIMHWKRFMDAYFSKVEPVYYCYEAQGAGKKARLSVTAMFDQNCDGKRWTFSLTFFYGKNPLHGVDKAEFQPKMIWRSNIQKRHTSRKDIDLLLTGALPLAQRSLLEALQRLGPAAKGAANFLLLSCRKRRSNRAVVKTLVSMGGVVIPILVQAIKKQPRHMKSAAAFALTMMGVSALKLPFRSRKTMSVLGTLPLKKYPPERKAAYLALQKLVSHKDSLVRRMSVNGLMGYGIAAIPTYFSLLRDPDPGLRSYVRRILQWWAVRKMPKPMLEHLVKYTSHSEASLAVFACQLLGKMGAKAKTSIPPLQKALKHKSSAVRRAAKIALQTLQNVR